MRKTIETGRFTIRNPIAVARQKAADHPMGLFATLAGATMIAFAFAPQASALAADEGMQVAALSLSDAPARQPAVSGAAADRICAGQAWGHESNDCLVALARDAGGKPQASIRIIEIQ